MEEKQYKYNNHFDFIIEPREWRQEVDAFHEPFMIIIT